MYTVQTHVTTLLTPVGLVDVFLVAGARTGTELASFNLGAALGSSQVARMVVK